MRQAVVIILLVGVPLWAQATRPSTRPATVPAGIEIRATQAVNSGEYAVALPLLQKLAAAYQNDPSRLGPIEEQIRLCERNLNSNAALQASPDPAGGPRKAHVKPNDGEVLAIGIKDLGNFDYDGDRGGNVPADVKALSGSTLRLTGFMIPTDQADNITQFALVPSLANCCFGQPPQVQHTVMVRTPKGKAVGYFPDEIVIEGKLTVEEKKDDGLVLSLFEVEAKSVKPAPK